MQSDRNHRGREIEIGGRFVLVPRKRRDGGEIRFQPLDELARGISRRDEEPDESAENNRKF